MDFILSPPFFRAIIPQFPFEKKPLSLQIFSQSKSGFSFIFKGFLTSYEILH